MPRATLLLICAALTGCGAMSIRSSPSPIEPGFAGDVTGAVQRYAAGEPDVFGGLYLDGGLTVVQFTDDLARHDAALQALGIAAGRYRLEQVDNTEAELLELQREISDELASGGIAGAQFVSSSVATIDNVVEVTVKSNDPDLERQLRARYGDAEVLDLVVAPLVEDWEQPDAGDGWRLLGHGRVAESYTVRVASDPDELAALWETLGIAGAPPEVDFAQALVVSFVQGIGSGCPEMRLDGVEVDGDAVFPRLSDPLAPRNCTADLVGGQAFVVALDRESLPGTPFRVRLAPPDQPLPCGGDCGSGAPAEVRIP
jgi:hypothetical protein